MLYVVPHIQFHEHLLDLLPHVRGYVKLIAMQNLLALANTCPHNAMHFIYKVTIYVWVTMITNSNIQTGMRGT